MRRDPPDTLLSVGDRWQRLSGEVVKYAFVGVTATVVAFVIFNLLVHGMVGTDLAPLHSRPLTAYVIANGVGMVISYHGTKQWAFRHRGTSHLDGGLAAFVGINLVTMTIPIACLWFSRAVLGLDDPFSDNIAANLIGLGFANVSRFLLFRQLVFNAPAPARSAGAGRRSEDDRAAA